MIAPAPVANQIKKKVFVKIGRPGTCILSNLERSDVRIGTNGQDTKLSRSEILRPRD
jgi:hypothetical protein